MRIFIAILLILKIFGLPVTALAQESFDGVIDGQVTNDTEGGGSVAEMEVTLIIYIDNVMAETRTAVTDNEGKFRFDNVAREHEYLVTARYMEVDYYYPVVFETGEVTAHVEVWVCDATASDEAIRVRLSHIILSVEEENLQLTQIFGLINEGDKTYAGTNGSLVFTLPEGVTGFEAPQELMQDYRFLDGNRVTYLVPFPPGERQLAFSYRLAKPDSAEFTIFLAVDYPTDNLELMVGGEYLEVTTDRLAPAEPVITGTGERFIHFQGENLLPGTVLNLHLVDLSKGSQLTFVIPCVIIAGLIAGIVVYLMKRRKKEGKDE